MADEAACREHGVDVLFEDDPYVPGHVDAEAPCFEQVGERTRGTEDQHPCASRQHPNKSGVAPRTSERLKPDRLRTIPGLPWLLQSLRSSQLPAVASLGRSAASNLNSPDDHASWQIARFDAQLGKTLWAIGRLAGVDVEPLPDNPRRHRSVLRLPCRALDSYPNDEPGRVDVRHGASATSTHQGQRLARRLPGHDLQTRRVRIQTLASPQRPRPHPRRHRRRRLHRRRKTTSRLIMPSTGIDNISLLILMRSPWVGPRQSLSRPKP